MIRYGARIRGRFLSTQAIPITDIKNDTYKTSSTRFESTPKPNTIGHLITQKSSRQYLDSVSTTHFNSMVEQKFYIKSQLYDLVKDKQYSALLEAIMTISKNFHANHLTQQELTYFIKKLIDHQQNLLIQLVHLKRSKASKGAINNMKDQSDKWRRQIRKIYSNLLFKSSATSIYARSLRDTWHTVPKSFNLSVSDYEALMEFEYTNSKPDLVNKWFDRFIAEHGESQMTNDMWKLRFKLNGGDPKLWNSFKSELYSIVYKVSESKYFASGFNRVLELYLKYNSIDDQIDTIIYCLGHIGKVDSIYQLVEDKYGINSQGKRTGHKSVPDLNVLTAIVTSLAYNKRYFESMVFINSFQANFDLDLNDKYFWDYLVKWTDTTTRYDEKLVLHHYVNIYCPKVKSSRLETLLNDANFDYEQYLVFLDQLKNKRIKVMKEIWNLYQESTSTFSASNYRIYGMFLQEIKDEDEYYKILQQLGDFHHRYTLKPTSFNFKYLGLNSIVQSIRSLYQHNLEAFIELKLNNQLIGQVHPLIEKWGLDEPMKIACMKYYNQRLPEVRQELENKRREEMIKQRQESEADEGLLELF